MLGHIHDAAYFVAPAYMLTFAAFAAMGFFVFRRLAVWSRRARDDEQRAAADQAARREQGAD